MYAYVVKAIEFTPDGFRQAFSKVVWHPDKYIARQIAQSYANAWSYFDVVRIEPTSVVNVEWVGKID